MAIKSRYWIDAKGPSNPEAIVKASEWMISHLKQGSVGLVVVPDLGSLHGVFAEQQPVLARALEYHGQLTSGGATIALMTENLAPKVNPNGPAMLLHASMNMIHAVEATEGVSRVLAVAWDRRDIEIWVKTWVPKRIPVGPPPKKR